MRSLVPYTGRQSIARRFSDMDHVVNSLWRGFGHNYGRANWFDTRQKGFSPAMDVKEEEGSYIVTAELPGLGEEDVNVVFQSGMLTISGEKKFENEELKDGVRYSERSYGSFQRQISLGDEVDRDNIGASFKDGLLVVTVPLIEKEEDKVKKIEVNG